MLAHHTVQKAEYWPNNWTVAGEVECKREREWLKGRIGERGGEEEQGRKEMQRGGRKEKESQGR